MEWKREEYLSLLRGEKPRRQMFVELFGPLVGLEEEWRDQGASEDELDLSGFEWDYVDSIYIGCNTDLRGGFEPVDLEETDEYVIRRDSLGRTVKLNKGFATIALPLDYPVKSMEDWLTFKPKYEYHDDRIDWEAIEQAKRARDGGAVVTLSIPGGYDLPRQLMGEEESCVSFLTQPELIHDILTTVSDSVCRIVEQVKEKIIIDYLFVHEDMAGKSGPLVGPNQINDIIGPYYAACWEAVKAAGGVVFLQDSDGDMRPDIQAFLDSGLNAMEPFEPAAGMDMVETRKQYGDSLAIKGGIDKHVLRKDKAAIRDELEYKMQPLMQNGGTIFGLDHRIPNGTPLENYRYYVQTGREILGLPRLEGTHKGWRRMAG